jgi:nucleoside 2-deoxyribosyltransferase
VIVVGGTYTETILYPTFTTHLVGSGLRAAAALGSEAERLVTVATSTEVEHIKAAIAADTSVDVIDRPGPVEFRYLDTSMRPQILGLPVEPPPILQCTFPDDDVLAFGFAELPSGYAITARRVVIDPQAPQVASSGLLDNVLAEKIAICANRGEARRMTGCDSPVDAASTLLQAQDVEAVVVKCGALGYVAADSHAITWMHATPTLKVRTLGSGDVFSSVFAREWFADASVNDAAATASNAVAQSAGSVSVGTLRLQPGYAPKVYLAGPFFTLAERWIVERVRAVLNGLGARVFSPIHDVGPGGIEVAEKDLKGLDDCDVVLALLDGFDPGTVYETGWAARENIPIVCFTSEVHAKETKMLVGMGAEVHTDLTSAMYRAVWAGQGLTLSPGVHGHG